MIDLIEWMIDLIEWMPEACRQAYSIDPDKLSFVGVRRDDLLGHVVVFWGFPARNQNNL